MTKRRPRRAPRQGQLTVKQLQPEDRSSSRSSRRSAEAAGGLSKQSEDCQSSQRTAKAAGGLPKQRRTAKAAEGSQLKLRGRD
ncbi:unnamed protein product [Danaus chrysippus]|uniref:(African queen) hypothetical protein n=1 Tax=Danaus chrysippus TaxID=151541 RepID=A0A8J2QII8_9NEOP|nr:unnamed protein product [Danaus chrysippus]